MSYDVEDKVVRMQFDNSDFQPNIDASIRSLGELEKALRYADGTTANFNGTEKKFDHLSNSIGNTLISVDKLTQGFSAMGVAAVTVISDITRKIEGMGFNTLNSLFVTPIKAGFAKYGDQISSTQVIMNNTGETIDRVKGSLQELNEYANKTIYNFSQMTYAVGKFAAAGVNLDDATLAIQGLSNAAAMVGANNAQLYSAYYNLSQSMQMGYLKLIDWKSIANSMIGTKQMRKEFVKTAIEMGKFTEDSEQAQEAFSNFEDSLRKKWLTSDVIVKTMQKYQDATTDVGKAAIAAASELKSFSQMWDVISQTTQSSWAKTWEIIIGDLGSAKTVWTNIGNRISAIMKAINDARNDFLADWNKDGRATQQILEGICNILNNIRIVLEPIYSVLVNILNITSDKLYVVTTFFRKLTESFELSEEAIDGFKLAITQIAKPIAFIVKAVGILIHTIITFISLIGIAGNIIFMFLSNIDKMPNVLTAIFGPDFAAKIKNINALIWNLSRIFGSLLGIIVRVTLGILPAVAPLLEAIGSLLLNVLSIIGEVLNVLADSDLEWLDNIMASLVIVIRAISTVLATIPNLLKTIFGGQSGEAFKTILNDASQLLVILSKLLATGLTIGAKILTTIAPLLERIGQVALLVGDIILGFLNGLLNIDATGFTKIFDGITNFILILLAGFSKVVDIINAGISAILKNIGRVSKFTNDLGSAISTKVNVQLNTNATVNRESIDKVTESIQNTIVDNLSNTEEITNTVVNSIEEGTINAIPNITKSTKVVTKAMTDNISNIDGDKIGGEIVSKVSKGIVKSSPKLKTSDISSNIKDSGIDSKATKVTSNITTEFQNGLEILKNTFDNFKKEMATMAVQIAQEVANLISPMADAPIGPGEKFNTFLDNFFTIIEKHSTTIKSAGKFINTWNLGLMGIIALIVAIVKITDLLNYGKKLENASKNLAKITDFSFEHSFKKETITKAKTTIKTINAYGKAILMMSAGLALVIAAVGGVLKLAENYDLSKKEDQVKFWAIIGTINLIVMTIAGSMIALSIVANKASQAASITSVDFQKAAFNIKDAFKSIRGGISSFTGALVSLPTKLVRRKEGDKLLSMSKVITSVGIAFAAVMAGVVALLAITKIYNADELKSRLIAIGVLISIISGTLVAVTAIISSHAKKLTGSKYQSDNITALGNAIKGIIGSLGAVAFALKFLFNDKKAFSMPPEYLVMVGMLFGTIIALTTIMIVNVRKLQKNYAVMDRVFQDERIKHISRGISLIILAMSGLVLSLSAIKGIETVPTNLVRLVTRLFTTVIGLTLLIIFNVNKLGKIFTSGSGEDKKIFGDNRIIKLAASISGIIFSMSFLVSALRNLRGIGVVNDNVLSIFSAACIAAIALSLIMVLSIDNLFKSASSSLATTKERANRVIKLAASMSIIIGSVASIIISLRALNGLTINEGVTGLVATTLGIAAGMAGGLVVLTKLFDKVNFSEFAKTIFALGGCVISIGILVNYLKQLNGLTIEDSVITMMGLLGLMTYLLLIFITKVNGNRGQFTEAMESVAALIAITGSLLALALSIRSLSNVNINLMTLAALLTAGGMVAAFSPLIKMLGKIDIRVLAIGAAAIIVLTGSIIGLAGALNILSESNMQNLADGLKNITDAIDEQGFKKMAEFIGFMWMLGFSLMIAAPGIAIAGLSIAGSIWILSQALPNITAAIEHLELILEHFLITLKNTKGQTSTFFDNLSTSTDKINKLTESISALGGAFVTLGLGMLVTGVAMWLINKRVFSFVAMAMALAVAIDIAALGIWAISKNIEGFEAVLDSLENHLLSIITTIMAIGSNGKGGMYLGIGFAALGFAILEAAKAVKVFGQGILWVVAGVAAAIIVFKLLDNWLGGKLTDTITKLGEAIKNLFGNSFLGNVARIAEIITVIALISIVVTVLGNSIKKFGQGLIWLGVGALVASGGLSIFAKAMESLMALHGGTILGNLVLIAIGIGLFTTVLSLVSPLLGIVLPLLPAVAGGLMLVGLALKDFDTNKNYAMLGAQLIGLALGLMALAGASALVDYLGTNIASVVAGLSIIAQESIKWVSLSVNIRTIFTNIGAGILEFATSIHDSLVVVGNGINSLAEYILLAITNISNSISAVGSGIQGFFTNIGLGILGLITGIAGSITMIGAGIQGFFTNIGIGILTLAQSIGAGISSIGSGIYNLGVGIGDGINYIANSIMTASQMIVVAANNIATAIDKVTTSIINAKNSFSGGFSLGNIFGGSSGKTSGVSTKFEEIGSWISKSLAVGITKSEPIAKAAVLDLATNTEETFRDDQGIHSLSELWAEIGAWISKSLGIGIETNADGTFKSLTILENGISNSINKWTNGALEKAVNNAGGMIGGLLNKIDNIKKNGISGLLGEIDLKKTLGIDVDSFKDMFKGVADQLKIDTESMGNFANSIGNVDSAASSAKGTIESLTDTIKNQMKIFERFTYDEEMISPKELINNMKSQIRGVRNWASGLDILTARGISGPLLQYLSEMGPEGYKYVEAFLEMTEDEFAQANELYTQSLDVPSTAANQIADDYRALGVDIVEAVKSGGAGVAEAAGDAAEETVKKVHDISLHGTNTTVEEILAIAKESGPNAMMHWCTEANKWLTTPEFNALAAQMQGKLTGVMHMGIGDALKDMGFKRVYQKPLDNLTYEMIKKDYGKETGTFFIDEMTKALTADEYLEECNKRGEVISAYISDGVDVDNKAYNLGLDYTRELADGIVDNKVKAEEAGTEVGEAVGNATGEAMFRTGIDWLDKFLGLVDDTADKATSTMTNKLDETQPNSSSGTQLFNGNEQLIFQRNNLGQIRMLAEQNSSAVLKWTVNGITKSGNMEQYLRDCNNVGVMLTSSLVSGMVTNLEINSPSKKTAEIGRFSVLGFVDGIMKNLNLAENASEILGDDTLTSLADTIQAISSQFTDDMDTTPTIRPVLDLDNVYTGMAELDTMFSTNQARIAGSAYMTTHDDSVERLEEAYRKAIMDGNLELANMLLNSEDTNVIVDVHLDANAEGIFDLVKVENEKATKREGASPLMIARRNAMQASLVH